MKKTILILFAVFIILIIYFLESRSFYCVGEGRCITVWKTINNQCYIIPGKYYGLIKPAKNFIMTSNTDAFTIYFTDQMQNSFLYRGSEEIQINNDNMDAFIIYNYDSDTSRFRPLLYGRDAIKHNDLKPGAQLIDLFIDDNFALDKNGLKL